MAAHPHRSKKRKRAVAAEIAKDADATITLLGGTPARISPETETRIRAGVAKFLTSKPRKMHDADVAAREAIGRAREFGIFQQRRPAPYREHGFATMADAIARAQVVEVENTSRPCIIYAFVDGTAHPVPRDVRDANTPKP